MDLSHRAAGWLPAFALLLIVFLVTSSLVSAVGDVGALTMRREVKALILSAFRLSEPETGDQVQNLEYDEGSDAGVSECCDNGDHLPGHLLCVALDQPGSSSDGLDGEDASSQRAPDSGDAVDAKDLKGVIESEPRPIQDEDVGEDTCSDSKN